MIPGSLPESPEEMYAVQLHIHFRISAKMYSVLAVPPAPIPRRALLPRLNRREEDNSGQECGRPEAGRGAPQSAGPHQPDFANKAEARFGVPESDIAPKIRVPQRE